MLKYARKIEHRSLPIYTTQSSALFYLRINGGEGDINQIATDVAASLMRMKLTQVFASDKPYVNIRLTAKGRSYAMGAG